MNVVPIDGTGEIVPEPDWESLFSDVLDVEAAKEHWRIITGELRERDLLSPSNGPAIQRLVCSYIFHARNCREVAENGSVTKPRRGNTKAIARLSPFHSAMREMAADAAALESELGLSPAKRGKVTKVQRGKTTKKAADSYLSKAGG